MDKITKKISIIGCGNIGSSIADGLLESGMIKSKDVYLTRRDTERLKSFKIDTKKVSHLFDSGEADYNSFLKEKY